MNKLSSLHVLANTHLEADHAQTNASSTRDRVLMLTRTASCARGAGDEMVTSLCQVVQRCRGLPAGKQNAPIGDELPKLQRTSAARHPNSIENPPQQVEEGTSAEILQLELQERSGILSLSSKVSRRDIMIRILL